MDRQERVRAYIELEQTCCLVRRGVNRRSYRCDAVPLLAPTVHGFRRDAPDGPRLIVVPRLHVKTEQTSRIGWRSVECCTNCHDLCGSNAALRAVPLGLNR